MLAVNDTVAYISFGLVEALLLTAFCVVFAHKRREELKNKMTRLKEYGMMNVEKE